MRLEYTEFAKTDIKSYVAYIAEDSPASAREWAEKIKGKIEGLLTFPGMGQSIQSIEDSTILEIVIHSHRIIYRINDDCIEILRVWHGARNLTLDDIKGDKDE